MPSTTDVRHAGLPKRYHITYTVHNIQLQSHSYMHLDCTYIIHMNFRKSPPNCDGLRCRFRVKASGRPSANGMAVAS